jgi:hypothetical protein
VTRRRAALDYTVGALVALLALTATAQAKPAGVIPDIPTATHAPRVPQAHTADTNLPYGGGRVMHSNRTHLIFWEPAGSGLGFDSSYVSLLEGFLRNVAADSHKPTNVYGLSGQYTDASGAAAYSSSYAGAIMDKDALPGKGCTEPAAGPPGWNRCVNDLQVVSEIAHVLAAHRLPTGGRDIYFLVTPNGLGSCFGPGPDNCALGGAVATGYCGYHNNTPDGRILFAVIPYTAISGHCESDNPRPHGNAADPTISDLSHEHNETITDPYGDGWIDASGNENGDLCISSFGPSLGSTAAGPFNEVIHGGHYYLQEEYSNNDGGCQARDEADPVSFTSPSRAVHGHSVSFSAHASDPDGRIVAYDWYFGNGNGHHHHATHAFRRAGSYRVVLRAVDSSGNYAFASRLVTVR